jgi:uncharacterized membrane protein
VSERAPDGFRLRGEGTSRVEVFVDAAFAFAVTMLVIAIDTIPGSLPELIEVLKGTPAFAASFAAIMVFWWGHKTWSRRYGLDEDRLCTLLALLLVFTVMVYLYPLKVLANALFAWLSGGWLPAGLELTEPQSVIVVFQIYGIGFFALSLILSLLYWRARALAGALDLDRRELLITELEGQVWAVMAVTGLASALWAALLPGQLGIFAGFLYFSLFPSTFLIGRRFDRRLRLLTADLTREPGAGVDR